MKKLIILLILLPKLLWAQTYKQLADSALTVMNSAHDSVAALKAYPQAYALYQQAFKRYPAEVDRLGYYKATVLAAELNKYDEAFAYLNRMIALDDTFMILSPYAKGDFGKLMNDERWGKLVIAEKAKKQAFLKKLKSDQEKLENAGMLKILNLNNDNARNAYLKIKSYNKYPDLKQRLISMQVPLTDTLHMAFLIVLPPNYTPKKTYAVLFFLHGAVRSNTGYLDNVGGRDTSDWNRYYTKYAGKEVVMVYPHANRDYNWMLPDKGFFMVPAILKQVKQIVNVDDNRVFISGHSNGATGSFSYLMKQPSAFAGFYGFNTRPVVATGGTFLRNMINRSFFNVSVDQDYYYPPAAHDSLNAVMHKLGADYQDHRYNGYPHWFPQFDASEPAYRLLFNDLAGRKRNPFHPALYWECDDVKYGQCDWLKITALDTVTAPAAWQENINFPITKWIVLDKKSQAIVRDTLLDAYKYVKRSGAVKATYRANTFTVETSDVKAFSLLISPEMIDLKKPVTVIVNGKLYSKQLMDYNKAFMLGQFKATADRAAIWINHIDVKL